MVLILAACIGHHEPIRAASPTPVSVVVAHGSVVTTTITGPVDPLRSQLDAALSARNLSPTWAPTESFTSSFATTRDTRRRLELLAPTAATLLVETETAYYSELSGRFRWTVRTVVSLEPAGLTDTFEVPVFLQFAHEGEAEAVGAASPAITRHVSDLLDGWLAAP